MKFTDQIEDDSTFKRLMFDTNVIIPFLDKKHAESKDVEEELNRLYRLDINFYYSQPCLLEILNYWRIKWLYTACLTLKRYAQNLPKQFYGIVTNAETELISHKRTKYLYDHEVKNIRASLISRPELWSRLVSTIGGKMNLIETELIKINFQYAKFNSEIYPVDDKANWPRWEIAYSFIEKYGLASNDAAILNMANYKTIDGFVSNDGDIEFAVSKGAYPREQFFGL
jgi:predicted nucleic acid-binding protein